MTDRIETEALTDLVEHCSDCEPSDDRLTCSVCRELVAPVISHGKPWCWPCYEAPLIKAAPALAAEVLELRAALSAAAPAMAAMHSSAKAVFDDYELTIDHFGDLAARQAERIAALEAELSTAREGRDYGC